MGLSTDSDAVTKGTSKITSLISLFLNFYYDILSDILRRNTLKNFKIRRKCFGCTLWLIDSHRDWI